MVEGPDRSSIPVPHGVVWALAGPEGGAPAWAGSGRWIDLMLRACSDAGIEGVHAGLDPAAPARTPHLLEALQRADRAPKFVVLVAPPLDAPQPPPRHASEQSSSITVPAPRFEPARSGLQGLLEFRSGDPSHLPPRAVLSDTARDGGYAGWGIAYDAPPSGEALAAGLGRRPGWIRLPFHLLSPTGADEAIALAHKASVPVITSNPFADGRLDGSQLRGSPLESSARPAPADWAEVRRTWAPVLALGFLTEGHQRTLPQAALQFVMGTEGVVAALVPAADPAALMEAAVSLQRPDLSAAERDRARRQRASGSAPRPATRGSEFK